MIPLATTTVTVTEPAGADMYADPYETPAARTVTATKVRAVIDPAQSRQQREQLAGGEQAVWDFNLTCDEVAMSHLARVIDDRTGIDYRVVWVMAYPDHVEAGLRRVIGEV